MPNHIKNRIELVGTKEQIAEVVKAYSVHHPAKLNRAHDGSVICKDTNNDTFSVGWLDLRSGTFKERDKADRVGLPEGWEPEIEKAFEHFPDFDKVVPMPEEVKGSVGSPGASPAWYNWSCNNWGSKWNSYSCESLGANVFTFETAWSGVPKLIEIISKKFPEVEISYEFSDEDTGQNTGVYKFKDGCTGGHLPVSGSREAYELAFKHRPHYKEAYELIEGNYEYKEEEE